MLASELIKTKRDGGSLNKEELSFLISGYVNEEIPDYQMSAFLMATYMKGMTKEEASWLTEVMIKSGSQVNFNFPGKLAVDKHSTGGVGDKASLILAPIAAAAGVPVPMIAGRGLGHTGGTLDKLEAIPGFSINQTLEQFKSQVEDFGFALIGQTADLCPADKKMYGLRDVTATVESIPLICASIMSKKIAEGCQGLVLDVKFGSGAFMKTQAQAKELALWLKAIGENNGVKVRALLTNMSQPLGHWVGNVVEIQECIEILQNKEGASDTRELSLELAAHMIELSGLTNSFDEAQNKAQEMLTSGRAFEMFSSLCNKQGGKLDHFTMPTKSLDIRATEDGFLESYNTEQVGISGILIGAGRKKTSDVIDHSAGIYVHKKIGDTVKKGAKIFTLWGGEDTNLDAGAPLLEQSYKICLKKPVIPRLIVETIL